MWNARRLIDGAKILGLPVIGSEQYPKGLGPTVAELAERLGRTNRLSLPRAVSGMALLALSVLLMWTQTVNPFLYFQF